MGKRTCSAEGCDRPAKARGLCTRDYQRWQKHGDPNRVDQGREGSRKYALNEAFFDDVTTEVQAYWLGFVTADGCVIDSGRTHALRVELSARDSDHLERMGCDLGSTKPVSFHRTFAYISLDSWRLTGSLARLGVTPRKSATAEPWNGPEHLMRHYWRGLFDGDGSIFQTARDGIWNLAQVGSEACVKAFAQWAHQVCGSTATPAHQKGGCWRWNVCGGRKPQLLAEALYAGAAVSLARKQEKADELCGIDFAERFAASEIRRAAAIREAWASGRHSRAKRP